MALYARSGTMANIFILLSAVLSLTASNPIIVPHTHGQIYVPLFRHQLQQFFQQQLQHQQRVADRSDQQQSIGSDYGAPYSSNNGNGDYDAQEASNSVAQENDAQTSSHADFADQQQQAHDYSAFTNFNNEDGISAGFESHGLQQQHQPHYVQSVPVSEHVEVTKPVAVPVYKEIGIPVPHPVKINVPHPVTVGVPQPYPVAVPISHPVPIQIIKTVAVPVEKKVPYPVEKHIPVPVEKPVPIKIEKHVPVPVYKPYPIKVPVYKTIYHHAKGHSGHSRSYHDHDY